MRVRKLIKALHQRPLKGRRHVRLSFLSKLSRNCESQSPNMETFPAEKVPLMEPEAGKPDDVLGPSFQTWLKFNPHEHEVRVPFDTSVKIT